MRKINTEKHQNFGVHNQNESERKAPERERVRQRAGRDGGNVRRQRRRRRVAVCKSADYGVLSVNERVYESLYSAFGWVVFGCWRHTNTQNIDRFRPDHTTHIIRMYAIACHILSFSGSLGHCMEQWCWYRLCMLWSPKMCVCVFFLSRCIHALDIVLITKSESEF